MAKFSLHIGKNLRGDFQARKINLAFVFQVNCPGCFLYGIPMVNTLYRKFSNQAGFLGISTAFEDFTLNTEENTRLLLEDGTVVGETRKYLNRGKYPHPIFFPVAMDKLNPPAEFLTEGNILTICNINPNFKMWPGYEQKTMMEKVESYYRPFPCIAETFTLNQLSGTPSFIIFDEQYSPIQSWFGHVEREIVQEHLENTIEQGEGG